VAGKGVRGTVDGREVAVGNTLWMRELGIEIEGHAEWAEELRREGQSVVFVAAGGQAVGMLGLADPIRDSAPAALRSLRGAGIEVRMVTADGRTTAGALAEKLELEHYEAEVPPGEKGKVVERLQGWDRTVAVASPGVHDATALARADVGMVLGDGTDVELERGDLALVSGELRAVSTACRLGRAVTRTVRWNLVFAVLYNLIGLSAAASAYYAWTGRLVDPLAAAALSTLASAGIVFNALRLNKLEL
jgi:Cu+-exporting ATPase